MATGGGGAGVEVATGGSDGTVRVWDVRTWRCVDELSSDTYGGAGTTVNCVDMDGDRVAFGTAATELVIWDRAAGQYTYDGSLLDAVRGGAGAGGAGGGGGGGLDVVQFREELQRVEAEREDWEARREAVRTYMCDTATLMCHLPISRR